MIICLCCAWFPLLVALILNTGHDMGCHLLTSYPNFS
jgi:hypothetical protein